MNPRRVAAVAERIALGFRRDRRSLGLLIVAPLLVLTLVGLLWGANTQTIPTVVIATDRMGLPGAIGPRVVDGLVRSATIKGHTATYADGAQEVRDGRSDAVVWVEGSSLHILIECSGLLRAGGIAAAVQKSLAESLHRGIGAAPYSPG